MWGISDSWDKKDIAPDSRQKIEKKKIMTADEEPTAFFEACCKQYAELVRTTRDLAPNFRTRITRGR